MDREPSEIAGIIDTLGAQPEYIETEPAVTLRLLRVPCVLPVPQGKILFVAGWMSFSEAWRMVLDELRETHEIYYLESREKNSSRVTRQARFGIEEMVRDYEVVAKKLGVEAGNLDVVASSVGAATVIRAFASGVRPRRIALVSPVLRPEVPSFLPLMTLIAWGPMYEVFKILAAWWYGLFIYRVSRDEFQKSRFLVVLNGAEPWKALRGARDIFGLRVSLEEVQKVDAPVFILAASNDPQHPAKDIEEIERSLPQGCYHDFKSFRKTHSRAAGRKIREFFGGEIPFGGVRETDS